MEQFGNWHNNKIETSKNKKNDGLQIRGLTKVVQVRETQDFGTHMNHKKLQNEKDGYTAGPYIRYLNDGVNRGTTCIIWEFNP